MTEKAEKRCVYQTPDGAIATGDFGRTELRITPSRHAGLAHLRVTQTRPDGRRFFQIIEIDADTARHVSEVCWRVAREVGGEGAA